MVPRREELLADGEPLMDFRHLQPRGRLLLPGQPNARAVELTLLPSARLGREDWPEGSPTGVGSLSLNTTLDRLPRGLIVLAAKKDHPRP
jgi:hypothetical protein